MSLRRRLLITLAPLFVAGLIAVDVATYLSLRSFLVSQVDHQLFTMHMGLEQSLFGQPGQFGGPGGGGRSFAEYPPGTFVEIVSSTGTVLAHADYTNSNGDDAVSSLSLPSGTTPQSYLTVPSPATTSGFRVYVDEAETGPGSNTAGDLLVVGMPLDATDATLGQLLVLELVAGLAITLVVLLATWLIVRRGLRPLERMGRTARVAASDLSLRVAPAEEASEVGQLGLAINAMLSQLEAAFAERAANEQRLRHFVSDASHELRTPLTSMRGYAELLRRNPAMTEADVLLATRRIEEEAKRMGVLVDDLLLLARLDQGRPLERAPVDLPALVTDAAADARATDPARIIQVSIDAPVLVIGDDMRLRQVISNLVRNALVHTPAATSVELSLHVEGSTAVIEVADHGPGIAAEHAERIFERFHRFDPGRSRDQGGSGLGLSIAAAVVAAHGGRIEVRPTAGGGATFRVELPGAEVTAVSQTEPRSL